MMAAALERAGSYPPLADQIAQLGFGRSGEAILRSLARDLAPRHSPELLLFDLRAELEEALDRALLREHLATTPARATRSYNPC